LITGDVGPINASAETEVVAVGAVGAGVVAGVATNVLAVIVGLAMADPPQPTATTRTPSPQRA
jgi:hypothetical protein